MTTTRTLVSVLLVGAVLAGGFFATYRRADAVCGADPPGSDLGANDSRSLDLRLDGWRCGLTRTDGDLAAEADLGWWPTTDDLLRPAAFSR